MKKLIVFLLVFIILACGEASIYFSLQTKKIKSLVIAPTPPVFSEDKLWSLIQKWRTDNGFQPYIKDQRLCSIAEDRIMNDPPLDEHAGLYKKYSNYPYVISENLAENPTEQGMLDAWLASSTHLANLQKPYVYSCIDCRPIANTDPKQTYCDQIFSSLEAGITPTQAYQSNTNKIIMSVAVQNCLTQSFQAVSNLINQANDNGSPLTADQIKNLDQTAENNCKP